jgi:hypothetical protein
MRESSVTESDSTQGLDLFFFLYCERTIPSTVLPMDCCIAADSHVSTLKLTNFDEKSCSCHIWSMNKFVARLHSSMKIFKDASLPVLTSFKKILDVRIIKLFTDSKYIKRLRKTMQELLKNLLEKNMVDFQASFKREIDKRIAVKREQIADSVKAEIFGVKEAATQLEFVRVRPSGSKQSGSFDESTLYVSLSQESMAKVERIPTVGSPTDYDYVLSVPVGSAIKTPNMTEILRTTDVNALYDINEED